MSAVDEGLAGVVNAGVGYDVMEFSPCWPVTGYTELRYVTGYELTKKYVDVRWILTEKGMRYNLKSPSKLIKAHLLLPKGRTCTRLMVNGVKTPFREATVDSSCYIDFEIEGMPSLDFEIFFESCVLHPFAAFGKMRFVKMSVPYPYWCEPDGMWLG